MIRIELSLPDFTLPYLINGDSSHLDDQEIEAIDRWFDREFPNGGGHFATPEGDYESYFAWRHELTPYGIKGCQCADVTYVIMEDRDYVEIL
jgi:hypothetical protein